MTGVPKFGLNRAGKIIIKKLDLEEIDLSEHRTIDPAAIELLDHCAGQGLSTSFDRYLAQQPQCKFGLEGVCCRYCFQGPCRIIRTKKGADVGICGARDYTIVSRYIARTIAGGAATHSDHGREIATVLLETAEGKAPDYRIKDSDKLKAVAKKVGVPFEGRKDVEIAKDVAMKALSDFGKTNEDPCTWLDTGIDDERKRVFKKNRLSPVAIDRTVSEILHQTSVGTDSDPVQTIFGGIKGALSDYTGMALATDLTDILFGTPEPIKTSANLGALKKNAVNIAVNGHNPLLSMQVVDAAKRLEGEAKAAGASEGVNLVGICCTGNEVLMRCGVPMAANFGSMELAIMTGAVDVLLMDQQCIIPSFQDLCSCYHSVVVSTTRFSKIPGAAHLEFHPDTAAETADSIVRLAIERFGKRDPKRVHIPQHKQDVIGGFSYESLSEVWKKMNPASDVRAITDAVKSGQIKGWAHFAGCNNTRAIQDKNFTTIASYLAKNDVFISSTGCAAGAFAKHGFMNPEGIEKHAGPGLKAFLADMKKAAGADMPLAFHLGACVDNTRAQRLWTAYAKDMGISVPQLPIVACAAENMSEKSTAIGTWVVSMGLPVMVGVVPPVTGSPLVLDLITQVARDVLGGYFMAQPDPEIAKEMLLERIMKRRWRLDVHNKTAQEYETSINNIYEG